MRFLSIFLLLLLVYSCSKEDQSEVLLANEKNAQVTNRSVQSPCPTLYAVSLSGEEWRDQLFGANDFGYGDKTGQWDRVLNCPAVPHPTGCSFLCDFETVDFFLHIDDYPDFPQLCPDSEYFEDLVLSVTEQQHMLYLIESYAQAEAPTCPGSSIPMTPISYDTWWTYPVGTGNCFYVGVSVKYMPPCKYYIY